MKGGREEGGRQKDCDREEEGEMQGQHGGDEAGSEGGGWRVWGERGRGEGEISTADSSLSTPN